MEALFRPFVFGADERTILDRDGHIALPGVLADAACAQSRKEDSDTRWCVVYAYRNPGRESRARWLSPSFEKKQIKGAEGLMSLY